MTADDSQDRPTTAKLRIGAGAAELLSVPVSEADSAGRPSGYADEFEEGQLSGPLGPKFVGFGMPVPRPLWRDLLENAAFGIGVGGTIFALMMVFH